jgi:hypothetical protein
MQFLVARERGKAATTDGIVLYSEHVRFRPKFYCITLKSYKLGVERLCDRSALCVTNAQWRYVRNSQMYKYSFSGVFGLGISQL